MNPLFQRLADDFPEVFGSQLRPAPLTALSLVHATAGVPHVPTNAERLSAFVHACRCGAARSSTQRSPQGDSPALSSPRRPGSPQAPRIRMDRRRRDRRAFLDGNDAALTSTAASRDRSPAVTPPFRLAATYFQGITWT